ncbi:hypothetical protein JTB14_018907 [Gonioctena quinquepunctata]|nr:hypothetical protein JTB14_018907 [Gonioctena quinquepunctata]
MIIAVYENVPFKEASIVEEDNTLCEEPENMVEDNTHSGVNHTQPDQDEYLTRLVNDNREKNRKRKERYQVDDNQWQRKIAKLKIENGEEYKGGQNLDRKQKFIVTRPKRELKVNITVLNFFVNVYQKKENKKYLTNLGK